MPKWMDVSSGRSTSTAASVAWRTLPDSGWAFRTISKDRAGALLMDAMIDLAENWLNIQPIKLQVYADNESGISLCEKFGFEIEGTHRNHAFRDGLYVDSYTMARLRS